MDSTHPEGASVDEELAPSGQEEPGPAPGCRDREKQQQLVGHESPVRITAESPHRRFVRTKRVASSSSSTPSYDGHSRRTGAWKTVYAAELGDVEEASTGDVVPSPRSRGRTVEQWGWRFALKRLDYSPETDANIPGFGADMAREKGSSLAGQKWQATRTKQAAG